MHSNHDHVLVASLYCYIENEKENFDNLIKHVLKIKECAEKYPVRIDIIKDDLNKLLEWSEINKKNMQRRLSELRKARTLTCIDEVEKNPSCVARCGNKIISGW